MRCSMSACRSARTDSELDGRFIGVWGYMIMRGLRGSSQDVLSATQHRSSITRSSGIIRGEHGGRSYLWLYVLSKRYELRFVMTTKSRRKYSLE
jgi:hypothetical protein